MANAATQALDTVLVGFEKALRAAADFKLKSLAGNITLTTTVMFACWLEFVVNSTCWALFTKCPRLTLHDKLVICSSAGCVCLGNACV